ncbi:MAG: F0F1 ATP synthase subunit A, partial [Dehalococcoidia bacterium]|nr:F0F1 ATP synthase subunit A [Dehalococcoidia bacterium]
LALLPGVKTVGLAIPDYGYRQPVMQQAEIPLLGSVAYVPLTPDTVDTKAGEPPILSAQVAESLHLEEGEWVESPDGTTFSGGVRGIFRPVNTDITAPLAIAIFSFLFVEFWGVQTLGIGYLGKFFAFSALKKGPMGLIDVFVGLLELVSELSRIVSFTFRLFGNIFAGSVLMLMMTFLVPLVLVLPFYGLEIFVGAIQAFVFAVLTLVFATMAIISHHGDEHEEEHGEVHHAAH